jgi:hypothetical protein
VTHLIAALFFTLALLAAAVSIHMTVRLYWTEILLALKGEWDGVAAVRPTARPQAARAFAAQPKRAF